MLPAGNMGGCWAVVLQADNVVKLIDTVNPENTSEILTTHEEVKLMRVCYNGRYILTGGSRGDICLWSIKKREVTPEEVAQMISTNQQQ
jgi:WD40 repeat protein